MNGSSKAGRRAIKAVNVAHAGCDLAMATYYEVARMLVGRLTTTWSKRLGGSRRFCLHGWWSWNYGGGQSRRLGSRRDQYRGQHFTAL